MPQPEVYMFPMNNEHGFKVESPEDYTHMIATVISTTVELQADYPEHPIWVVYTLED